MVVLNLLGIVEPLEIYTPCLENGVFENKCITFHQISDITICRERT